MLRLKQAVFVSLLATSGKHGTARSTPSTPGRRGTESINPFSWGAGTLGGQHPKAPCRSLAPSAVQREILDNALTGVPNGKRPADGMNHPIRINKGRVRSWSLRTLAYALMTIFVAAPASAQVQRYSGQVRLEGTYTLHAGTAAACTYTEIWDGGSSFIDVPTSVGVTGPAVIGSTITFTSTCFSGTRTQGGGWAIPNTLKSASFFSGSGEFYTGGDLVPGLGFLG
jgi:hypothetical protein